MFIGNVSNQHHIPLKCIVRTCFDIPLSLAPALIVIIYASDYCLVGITTGCGLDDQGVGVRVLVGARIFTSRCRPDGSGARSASSPMGIQSCSPRG
jgi:hypothetical protein